jgi:hypothetical protein
MNQMIINSTTIGVVISVMGYELGLLLKRKFKSAIFNPLLISIIFVICCLLLFRVDYNNYNKSAQYLSYLVVEYDDKSYEEEIQRLEQYDSKEYKGYFGTRGFRDKYRLLAIEVDPDHGLIYALGEENNQIIYVELIFCNYFYDIDYQDEIDIQYLPIGFDATPDNEYRQKRLNQ